MRFRDYFYIDERLVESFAGQIGLVFSAADVVEREQKIIGAKGGVPALVTGDGSYSSEHVKTSKATYTLQQKVDSFERALADRNGVNNLDNSARAILESVEKDSMIRVSGILSFPELTESLAGFQALLPYVNDASLKEMLSASSKDADGLNVDALFQSLTKPAQTVPAIIDAPGFSVVVELKHDGILAGQDIAELVDEEVCLIGRVKRIVGRDGELEVVDPYRLLGINRSLRRKISSENQQMVEKVQGPAMKVQLLALWA